MPIWDLPDFQPIFDTGDYGEGAGGGYEGSTYGGVFDLGSYDVYAVPDIGAPSFQPFDWQVLGNPFDPLIPPPQYIDNDYLGMIGVYEGGDTGGVYIGGGSGVRGPSVPTVTPRVPAAAGAPGGGGVPGGGASGGGQPRPAQNQPSSNNLLLLLLVLAVVVIAVKK